jgi:hypothetical protein
MQKHVQGGPTPFELHPFVVDLPKPCAFNIRSTLVYFLMDDSKVISSKVSLTLDLPPSCIQFCPAHPDLFVVGTYNLEKNEEDIQENKQDSDDDEVVVTATKTPQSRNGSLLVYRVDIAEL